MRILESRKIITCQGRVIIEISESLDGPIDIEIKEIGGQVRINDPNTTEGKYFFFWKDILEKK